MYLLGLSAFYHDSAACLLKDGEIIEQGNHSELISKAGTYKKLYDLQHQNN